MPAISAVGTPSASATSGFKISGSNARADRPGLLLYGASGLRYPPMPFAFNANMTASGLLCIDGQVYRGDVLMSGGTPGMCDGTFAVDMNNFASGAAGGIMPQPFLTVPGALVYCQMFGRDAYFDGAYLTDTLEYCVRP